MAWLRSPFRRPPAPSVSCIRSLDAPLLILNEEGDTLRVRDFFEGVMVLGATGSGKSSGAGAACARAMLRAGWGGVVLCAKPDEAARWSGYLNACGRGQDLILMQPGSGWRFNFIEHEMRRSDGRGHDVFNLVALLMVVVEAMRVALGMPAQDGDGAFWVAAMRELLTNVIEPLVAATGRFRLDEMMRFITSAPSSPGDIGNETWREKSFFFWAMEQAREAPLGPAMAETSFQATVDYWFGNYAQLDPKTRSNIVATLTSAISPLLRGMLHETFCTDTTLVPELAHKGAVIVVDWPIKTTGPAGALAGQIVKYCWQRATEARPAGPQAQPSPSFLFVDEAQLFTSRYDPEFQSTARSALAATVYLTQNLPGLYAVQPGRDARAATDSLLGNFQTKIFHANTDPDTNRYASELIGKTLQRRAGGNRSNQGGWSKGQNASFGHSSQYGRSDGTSWSSGSSSSVTYGEGGRLSYNLGGSSQRGGQRGTSRSRGESYSQGVNEGVSGGWSEGVSWSEQMDDLVPPVAFASKLRKGGPGDHFLVDGVVVQGGRMFARTRSHWLHVSFRQEGAG